jgi:hypothetical protein
MGLFNYVDGVPEIPCPRCGQPMQDWQTKDCYPAELELNHVHFSEVDNFYAGCRREIRDLNAPVGHLSRQCDGWVEFSLPRRPPQPFEAYVRAPDRCG